MSIIINFIAIVFIFITFIVLYIFFTKNLLTLNQQFLLISGIPETVLHQRIDRLINTDKETELRLRRLMGNWFSCLPFMKLFRTKLHLHNRLDYHLLFIHNGVDGVYENLDRPLDFENHWRKELGLPLVKEVTVNVREIKESLLYVRLKYNTYLTNDLKVHLIKQKLKGGTA